MNRARLIWGTVCLAIAALLTAVNFMLPPERLMFMMGDVNMPWVPPIILAIVGVWLLISAVDTRSAKAASQATQPTVNNLRDPVKAALNQRLETIAWGCFLIMLGGFMFVPNTVISEGFWSIGIGLIMLGLNGARYLNHLKMSGFTTFLGIVALIGGVLQLVGVQGVEGALILIVLGSYLLVKPWIEQQHLFGKAEESRA